MTHDDVHAWLHRYIRAWQSYDREQIAALFSEDAEYRYHPWDEPLRGREAIVEDWLSPGGDPARRDKPGTVDAAYHPFAVEGDTAVAIGTSTYYMDASQTVVDKRYHNAYLIEFDTAGNCRSFTEFFMKEPAKS